MFIHLYLIRNSTDPDVAGGVIASLQVSCVAAAMANEAKLGSVVS